MTAKDEDGSVRGERGLVPPGSWADPVRHLREGLRNPWYRAISLAISSCLDATDQYHRGRGHIPVLMPITTGSISSPMGRGSDSLPVDIELFGESVYLADSMQFQLEYLLRQGHQGVYYVMPTFRGEDPDATHLNQFFHAEAEIIGGLDEVVDHVTGYVRALTMAVADGEAFALVADAAGGIDHLDVFLNDTAIDRITFREATEVLAEDGDLVVGDSGDAVALTRQGERSLIARHGGAVWVSHPPASSVPFYQAVDNEGSALAADLLFGIGEVVGCGQRRSTGVDVRQGLNDHEVHPSSYQWYVDMKDEFPLDTAGFGLGLERYLLWLLRHDDIRDIPVMPRLRSTPHLA